MFKGAYFIDHGQTYDEACDQCQNWDEHEESYMTYDWDDHEHDEYDDIGHEAYWMSKGVTECTYSTRLHMFVPPAVRIFITQSGSNSLSTMH